MALFLQNSQHCAFAPQQRGIYCIDIFSYSVPADSPAAIFSSGEDRLSRTLFNTGFDAESSSPIKNAQGCSDSTLPKTIFNTAMTGIDKNIPAMPQSISPATMPKNVTMALILTFDPTIKGNKILTNKFLK